MRCSSKALQKRSLPKFARSSLHKVPNIFAIKGINTTRHTEHLTLTGVDHDRLSKGNHFHQ